MILASLLLSNVAKLLEWDSRSHQHLCGRSEMPFQVELRTKDGLRSRRKDGWSARRKDGLSARRKDGLCVCSVEELMTVKSRQAHCAVSLCYWCSVSVRGVEGSRIYHGPSLICRAMNMNTCRDWAGVCNSTRRGKPSRGSEALS